MTRLSVQEQLALRRQHAAHVLEQTYGAGEIVDAYAFAFYRAMSPELAKAHAEFSQARIEGIHPRHAALLYHTSFSDIEAFVYGWFDQHMDDALQFATKLQGIPSLTEGVERESEYERDKAHHVKKLHALIKAKSQHPYDLTLLMRLVAFLYDLLEVFNHSGELSRREKETLPASLAMVAIEGRAHLTCLSLPQLASDLSYGAVYEGGSQQHTSEIRYPKSLWASDLSAPR